MLANGEFTNEMRTAFNFDPSTRMVMRQMSQLGMTPISKLMENLLFDCLLHLHGIKTKSLFEVLNRLIGTQNEKSEKSSSGSSKVFRVSF